MTDQQNEQSPYVEDKTVTWRGLSLGKRVAISAGALAVGTFALAGPAMPVIAQMVGIVDPSGQKAPLEGSAAFSGDGTPGIAIPGMDQPPELIPGDSVGTAQLPPNIQAVPPTSIVPANNGGQLVLPQRPGAVDFGNVSSATPGGSTWSGDDEDDDDDREGREHHGDHGDRGEHEDHDD